MVSSPDAVAERPRSARTVSSRGGRLANSVRRLSASRTIAAAAAGALRVADDGAPSPAPSLAARAILDAGRRRIIAPPVPAAPSGHAVGVTRAAPFLQDIPLAEALALG